MIIDLTPETFFEHINKEGPLHVIMHYGEKCGPCKNTMPHYQIMVDHFEQYNIKNILFYKFHQWDTNYKQFIEENNLKVNGVPTFRYYYYGETINTITASYNDPNDIKKAVLNEVSTIETNIGAFNLYES